MPPRICLNMIVKDEAHVIERCLNSVRPLITDWLIVDTGSTDGTQARIREVMADLPGELHERPWRDFAHNRTEALNLVPGDVDYVLFMDADDELRVQGGSRASLSLDAYDIETHYGTTHFLRRLLVRRALPWRWEGVLHEYLTGPAQPSSGVLPGVSLLMHHEGARSRDPQTYRKDAEILERALQTEPDNTRYVFYLAQSYRDAGEPAKAAEAYLRRAGMGGWQEEVFYSLYQAARLREGLGQAAEAVRLYLAAYQTHPGRPEALYHLGMHYQRQQQFALAHLFLDRAAQIVPPPTALFSEPAVHEYLAALEAAVAEYYLGRHREALARYKALRRRPNLPKDIRDLIARNEAFSLEALKTAPR